MKKILLMSFVAVAASCAFSSELYWQIQAEDSYVVKKGESAVEWATATLYATSETPGHNVGAWDGSEQIDSLSKRDIDFGAVLSASDKYTSGYKFFVELTTSAGDRVVATDLVAYNTLKSAVSAGGMSSPTSAYTFTGFTTEIVPEPTSGLLVLLGAVALGLKRKRV